MVKWNDGERFRDEPQFATRLPVLILRSARAPTARQSRIGRARVSKDEDGHALMLRDASQRCRVVDASVLASRCDAPQHEGGSARMKNQPAAVGNDRRAAILCFRIVIYNELRNSNVSSVKRARSADPRLSGVGPRAERRHGKAHADFAMVC